MTNPSESSGMQPSRRQFVQAGVGLGAAGLAAIGAVDQLLAADANRPDKPAQSLIKPGDTILFQGDSITDAGRSRTTADAQLAAGARRRLRLAGRGPVAG